MKSDEQIAHELRTAIEKVNNLAADLHSRGVSVSFEVEFYENELSAADFEQVIVSITKEIGL